MDQYRVVTQIAGRKVVAGYYASLEEARKVAEVLTEGSMSNPRACCVYFVEEVQ